MLESRLRLLLPPLASAVQTLRHGMPSSVALTLLVLVLASHTRFCSAQDSDVMSPSFSDSSSSSSSLSSSSLAPSSPLSLSPSDSLFRSRLRQVDGLFQYEPEDNSREQEEAAPTAVRYFVKPANRLPDLYNLRLKIFRAEQGLPVKRHRTSASGELAKARVGAAGMRLDKRMDYFCDMSRITIQIIFEYLRTGKICGFRVSKVRFGLGGRR